MVVQAQEVLERLLQHDKSLLDWVDRREQEVFDDLKAAQPTITSDTFTFVVRVLALEGASDPTHPGHLFAAGAAHELKLRLRGTGWDQVEVNLAVGRVEVKRFRRRVLVTVRGYANELSSPVYGRESYEQAATRIIGRGMETANYKGPERGIVCISPTMIERVRIASNYTA